MGHPHSLASRVPVVGLLTTAMLFPPTQANAQSPGEWDICMPEALQVCASVEIATHPTVVGGEVRTEIILKVSNWEGWRTDSPATYGISGISLLADSVNAVHEDESDPKLLGTLEGSAEGFSSNPFNPGANWFWDRAVPPAFGGVVLNIQMDPIYGCSLPASASAPYFRTCGQGFVVFDFSVPSPEWNVSDVNFADIGFSGQGGGSCGFIGHGQQSAESTLPEAVCSSITPEPNSLALLGSGLIVFLGVTALSRRT